MVRLWGRGHRFRPVFRFTIRPGLGFGLWLGLGFGLWLRLGFGLWLGLGFGLWLGLGLLVQKFAGALLQRRQVIRDAPGYLVSIGGEINAADQLRRGLELDLSLRAESFLHRTFDRGPLCRRQIEGAMHAHRVVRCFEGGRQLLLGRAGQRTDAGWAGPHGREAPWPQRGCRPCHGPAGARPPATPSRPRRWSGRGSAETDRR